MTLNAFVGHEGHDCTLEVERRDAEKLRELFSSSHISQTSTILFSFKNQLSQQLFTLFDLLVTPDDHSNAE